MMNSGLRRNDSVPFGKQCKGARKTRWFLREQTT